VITIRIRKENVLPGVAAQHYMVKPAGKMNEWFARHAENFIFVSLNVKI